MKLSDVAPYLEEGPICREPGGLTMTVTVKLDTPRKVLAFAWDMGVANSGIRWWWRPMVSFCVLFWGARHLVTTRGSP